MKILLFGTCRTMMIWQGSNLPINTLSYPDVCGGLNAVSLTQDLYQAFFLLKIYIEKRVILPTDNDYPLLCDAIYLLNSPNNNTARHNLIKAVPDWDINKSIENIHNQLNNIDFIIIEVCTLKRLIINGVPMYLDLNHTKRIFEQISNEDFDNDFDTLVHLINSLNPNIKIIFVSHFSKYNGTIIPNREEIFNRLNKNCEKYNNCSVLNPSDYITDEDLEDSRHYKYNSFYKIRNMIIDKINSMII